MAWQEARRTVALKFSGHGADSRAIMRSAVAKSHIFLPTLALLLAFTSGCSAIVEFDRTQIVADGAVTNRVDTPDGTLIGWAGDFRPGNVVVGWAHIEDDDTPVELEVVDESGAVVGTGTANLERPDVVASGHSDRADVGYQIEVTGVSTGEELTVQLAGTDIALPNSPIIVDL